ncbi:MAG: hypothetical protein JJU46_09410 [Balneolaceae bacterium]|nr:hypothetical protein [Balneolaceae bacterium]MCH8549019.1 hypothetical protein [Balneolaceae bacterium]
MTISRDIVGILGLYGVLLFTISCTAENEHEAEDLDAPFSLEQVNSWSIHAPELIPNPVYAGVLEDGSLVIIDRSLNTINHFDAEGNHLETRGGEGRGPGEYLSIVAADFHPDGRIAIADISNARISIVSFHDEEEITVPLNSGWNTQLQWKEPGLVIFNHPFNLMATTQGDILMRLYDPETNEKEEFFQMELIMSDPPFEEISCTFCWFQFNDDLSFYTAPQDTSYRIFRVNPETGEETLFSRGGVQPVAYTEEERERLAESRSRSMQATGVDAPNDYRAPQYRNRFRNFFADDSGRLWAQLNGRADDPIRIDIFSPDAEYIGSLNAPDNASSIQYTKGGYLLVRYRNDDPDSWKGGLYKVSE